MKLAIEPKAFIDESLNSWLIRSSIANGSDPKSFYVALFNKYKAWYKDIDKYLPHEQTLQLSKLTSLDPQQVHNLTLEPHIKKIVHKRKLNRNSLWCFVIPTGRRGLSRVNGIHFCPECLKSSNPYLKRQWRLSWNIGCSIHKIKLLNKCQKCNTVFAPQQLNYDNPYIYFCTSCGLDLRDSKTYGVDKVALKFQEALNSILFNDQSISFPALQEASINDLFMTIRIFIPFIQYAYKIKKYAPLFEILNLDISYIKNNKIVHVFEKMCIDDREFFLKLLHKILLSDIDKIKKLLEQIGCTHKTLHRNAASLPPTILYLSKNLKDAKDSSTQHSKQDVIKPNNKNEVSRLYSELLKYL